MNKSLSLNKNRDFRYVYNRGKSSVSFLLVIYVIKNRENINRIGITASKKIGNAVKRNRARRIIRAAYNKVVIDDAEKNYDIVFVARGRTVNSNSNAVYSAMIKQFKQLNIKIKN